MDAPLSFLKLNLDLQDQPCVTLRFQDIAQTREWVDLSSDYLRPRRSGIRNL